MGKLRLILQGQIAVVDELHVHHLGVTRLPQRMVIEQLGGVSGFLPRFHIGAVHQLNIQITGLDLVDTGACGVGEPCEGSAYQHGQAQNHGHDAAQQGPFGTLAVCHNICLLFLRVPVLAVGLCGGCGEYGSPRRGCAPPQNDTFFDPSLSFL